MKKIKVLVVEDEMIIADTIVDALEGFGYEVLEPAITYTEALERIEEKMPSIGIFDIQLSGKKSGIDLAKVVNEKYNFPFIFLTSNSDKMTLEEVKQVQPASFLVKPFNNEELYAAIEIALYSYSQQNNKTIESLNSVLKDCLFLKQKDGFSRVNYADILFIKSDNVYLDFYLTNGKRITVRGTVSEYVDKLPMYFLNSHRSYIVNANHLQSVGYTTITIQGQELPINKQSREAILNIVNQG